jgi:hypothetical protein
MSSEIRTVLVGVGVAAVCIAMASLKGHHLLMAFAAASLAGSIWTWMHRHKRKPMPEEQLETPAQLQTDCPPRRAARAGATSQRMRTSAAQPMRTSATQPMRTSASQPMRTSATQDPGKVYSFPMQRLYSDVLSS